MVNPCRRSTTSRPSRRNVEQAIGCRWLLGRKSTRAHAGRQGQGEGVVGPPIARGHRKARRLGFPPRFIGGSPSRPPRVASRSVVSSASAVPSVRLTRPDERSPPSSPKQSRSQGLAAPQGWDVTSDDALLFPGESESSSMLFSRCFRCGWWASTRHAAPMFPKCPRGFGLGGNHGLGVHRHPNCTVSAPCTHVTRLEINSRARPSSSR
jgi:hypothetical protein